MTIPVTLIENILGWCEAATNVYCIYYIFAVELINWTTYKLVTSNAGNLLKNTHHLSTFLVSIFASLSKLLRMVA